MEIIKLNEEMGKLVNPHGFRLSSTKEYEIDLSEELPKQMPILQAVQVMGLDGFCCKLLKRRAYPSFDSDIKRVFPTKY